MGHLLTAVVAGVRDQPPALAEPRIARHLRGSVQQRAPQLGVLEVLVAMAALGEADSNMLSTFVTRPTSQASRSNKPYASVTSQALRSEWKRVCVKPARCAGLTLNRKAIPDRPRRMSE